MALLFILLLLFESENDLNRHTEQIFYCCFITRRAHILRRPRHTFVPYIVKMRYFPKMDLSSLRCNFNVKDIPRSGRSITKNVDETIDLAKELNILY